MRPRPAASHWAIQAPARRSGRREGPGTPRGLAVSRRTPLCTAGAAPPALAAAQDRLRALRGPICGACSAACRGRTAHGGAQGPPTTTARRPAAQHRRSVQKTHRWRGCPSAVRRCEDAVLAEQAEQAEQPCARTPGPRCSLPALPRQLLLCLGCGFPISVRGWTRLGPIWPLTLFLLTRWLVWLLPSAWRAGEPEGL